MLPVYVFLSRHGVGCLQSMKYCVVYVVVIAVATEVPQAPTSHSPPPPVTTEAAAACAAVASSVGQGQKEEEEEEERRRRRQRLQAVVDIFGVWESEVREAALGTAAAVADGTLHPIAEHIRRSRAEAAVMALVGPAGATFQSQAAGGAPGAGGAASVVRLEGGRDEGGAAAAVATAVLAWPITTAAAAAARAGPIMDLLQLWWPRLMVTAMEAREWNFLCM